MCNCTNCIHVRVCGSKEKYKQYIKEFNELNKKWELFEKNPSCPEFTDKSLLRVNQKQDNWFNTKPLDNVTKVTYNDNTEEENKANISKTNSDLRQSIKNAEKLYYKNRNKDIPITVIGSEEFINFANILETIINYKHS
jgi:hypothetical protein